MKNGRKIQNFIKRFFVLTFVCIMAAIPTINADAAMHSNGYVCTRNNPGSGRLIIGDSRTCQLSDFRPKMASCVALWGGHYGYGGNSYQIDYSSRITLMKNYAQACIKKVGKCDIYVFATINDYDPALLSRRASDVVKLAETARSWTAKYSGKTVRPTVHVIKLIPKKGQTAKDFNNILRTKVAASSKIKNLMDISGCRAGANGGYTSPDNTHYTNETLKNIWNRL